MEKTNNTITETTKIITILDRSGSMQSTIDDAIGGFNTFLTEQQEIEGKAIMTIVQFDDQYDIVCKNIDIREVQPLNRKTFVPRGSTALLDAIGKTINDEIDLLGMTPPEERCDKTLIIVITDGGENASRKFNGTQISDMIKEQREVYGWEFIFIGSNQDAIATARGMNISTSNSYTYSNDSIGINMAYSKMSMASKKFRGASKGDKLDNLMEDDA